jgi:hypothetical protein
MVAILYFSLISFVLIGTFKYLFYFLFKSKWAIIGWIIIIMFIIKLLYFPDVCHVCLDGGYIDGK